MINPIAYQNLMSGLQSLNYSSDQNKNIDFNTSSPMSFDEFYSSNAYGLLGNIHNFMTGDRIQAEKDYQNYLSEYEYRRNQESSAKANLETWNREDTAVQRLVADITAAGLNPWLALNGGSLSSPQVSSASKAQYKRPSKEEAKNNSTFINSALKVLALIAIKTLI